MKEDTQARKRGRPAWHESDWNGLNWERDGLKHLLHLRCRALIAASFAEGTWRESPWRARDWAPVAVAVRKVLSLFLQAESTVNTVGAVVAIPDLLFTVSYEGAKDVVSIPLGTPDSRVAPRIKVHTFGRVNGGEPFKVSITVAFAADKDYTEAVEFIERELEFQTSLEAADAALQPRPGFGVIPALTRDDRLWDVRVRFSDFLRRFLNSYRVGSARKGSVDPFMVFFLAPCAHLQSDNGGNRHIASGVFGYRYELDTGQEVFLRGKGGNLPLSILQKEGVRFPTGLCSRVYLSGRATGPANTNELLQGYEATNSDLARIEREILRRDSVLLEVPLFDTGLVPSDVSPDGPEGILCVCIPKAYPPAELPPPRSAAGEMVARLTEPPQYSGLERGECQAIFEMAQRLISRYVRVRVVASGTHLVGTSELIRRVHELVDRFAPESRTVLIQGETGTGKEVLAKMIGDRSGRKPFVTVDVTRLAPTLIESQLFGHKKGAFTGADRDFKGYFERASGGTVFIDEIAELPLELQVKLLRVIQDKTIEPLGATSPVPVDVRVIAATRQVLSEKVASGEFREDLFYRINVLQIEMPPLRERPEDIPWLVEYFLAKESLSGVVFDDAAWLPLLNHPWPGNVRELENVVSRAVIDAEHGVVSEAVVVRALKQGGKAAMSKIVLDVAELLELRDLVNEHAARSSENHSDGPDLPVLAGRLDALLRAKEV
jgi:hypothetical protein